MDSNSDEYDIDDSTVWIYFITSAILSIIIWITVGNILLFLPIPESIAHDLTFGLVGIVFISTYIIQHFENMSN